MFTVFVERIGHAARMRTEKMANKISILGTDYDLEIVARSSDPTMIGDGYVDTSVKKIRVADMLEEDSRQAKKDLKKYQMDVIRHELVHAFLYESGLDSESWGRDEMIVDWIALQLPKINRAVAQAEIACGQVGDLDLYKMP